MHLVVIPRWANEAFVLFVLLVSLWKGGWRHRTIAATIAFEVTFSSYLCGMWTCSLARIATGHPAPDLWRPSVDDGIVLAVCLACARRSACYWSLAACSVALLGVMCDLTIYLRGFTPWSVLSASLMFTYLLDLTVVWGVWSASQRPHEVPARIALASGRMD